VIDLAAISKRYMHHGQVVEALQPLTEFVREGEFVVVTGRSGAGKSTLLSIVGGLIRPDGGRVRGGAHDLWEMSDRERSRFRCRTMGFIFQFASLIPTLTVAENVLLPTAFLPPGEGGTKDRAAELLDLVGLSQQARRLPWQLSGGQQKRVAVARALLHRPPLILADEPTADLDEETEREIIRIFAELNRRGTTVLLATHNSDLVALATRHLVISGGRVVRAS